MPKIHVSRLIWPLIAVCSVIVIYFGLQSPQDYLCTNDEHDVVRRQPATM
jgi:hypothetical protein